MLRSILALALLLGVTGCSVLEEVDKLGKDPKAEAAAQVASDDGAGDVPQGGNQAKLRAYYNRSAEPVEEDPDNPIVNCRLSSGSQFMRKHDCTLRGGRA